MEDANISRRVKAQMAAQLIQKEKTKTFDNLKFSCNPELEKFMQLNTTRLSININPFDSVNISPVPVYKNNLEKFQN